MAEEGQTPEEATLFSRKRTETLEATSGNRFSKRLPGKQNLIHILISRIIMFLFLMCVGVAVCVYVSVYAHMCTHADATS